MTARVTAFALPDGRRILIHTQQVERPRSRDPYAPLVFTEEIVKVLLVEKTYTVLQCVPS